MIKRIYEVEFKKTGKRYLFTCIKGLFSNFSEEEIGSTYGSILQSRGGLNEVRETSRIYLRVLHAYGCEDKLTFPEKVMESVEGLKKMKANYYNVMKKNVENGFVSGLNILREYTSEENIVNFDGRDFVSCNTLFGLCYGGYTKQDHQRILDLGWKMIELRNGIYLKYKWNETKG